MWSVKRLFGASLVQSAASFGLMFSLPIHYSLSAAAYFILARSTSQLLVSFVPNAILLESVKEQEKQDRNFIYLQILITLLFSISYFIFSQSNSDSLLKNIYTPTLTLSIGLYSVVASLARRFKRGDIILNMAFIDLGMTTILIVLIFWIEFDSFIWLFSLKFILKAIFGFFFLRSTLRNDKLFSENVIVSSIQFAKTVILFGGLQVRNIQQVFIQYGDKIMLGLVLTGSLAEKAIYFSIFLTPLSMFISSFLSWALPQGGDEIIQKSVYRYIHLLPIVPFCVAISVYFVSVYRDGNMQEALDVAIIILGLGVFLCTYFLVNINLFIEKKYWAIVISFAILFTISWTTIYILKILFDYSLIWAPGFGAISLILFYVFYWIFKIKSRFGRKYQVD